MVINMSILMVIDMSILVVIRMSILKAHSMGRHNMINLTADLWTFVESVINTLETIV